MTDPVPDRATAATPAAWIADCLRPVPVGLAPPPVAPARIVAAVVHHRVAPLLVDPGPGVPADVRAALASERRARALAGMARLATVSRIVDGFARAGIPLVVVKGFAAGVQFHGDALRRDARDVDVVVPFEARAEAVRLLADEGFAAIDRSGPGPDDETLFRRPSDGSLLEMRHRTAVDPAAIGRVVRVPVPGGHLPVLPPEVALVEAAVHGWRHLWVRLVWLTDVAAAMARATIDWPAAVDLAERTRTIGHLRLATGLAAAVLGARPPAAVASALALGEPLAARRDYVVDLALHDPPLIDREAIFRGGLLRYLGHDLRMAGGWPMRWAAVRRHLAPTNEDRRMVDLPAPLAPLYRVVRLARIGRRALGRRSAGGDGR
jgi:hypothetical protein